MPQASVTMTGMPHAMLPLRHSRNSRNATGARNVSVGHYGGLGVVVKRARKDHARFDASFARAIGQDRAVARFAFGSGDYEAT